jgi:hypothetical protein
MRRNELLFVVVTPVAFWALMIVFLWMAGVA